LEVALLHDAEACSRLCEELLHALPEWFGLEEANREYVRAVKELPVFAAGRNGLLALKVHTEAAAEIHVMAVRPERHGQGIGTALVAAAEAHLGELGVEYLQVKTLGPSDPSRHYAATRRFYEARGFRPLEELTSVWGEANPCLIMVKRLG
jgi:GNAT superfamily N-acetyltransferase